MTDQTQTPADRLWGSPTEPAEKVQVATEAAGKTVVREPTPEPRDPIEALLDEPETMADRLFTEHEAMSGAQQYDTHVLASAFEQVERFDREAGQVDAEALRQGRLVSAELMAEWEVSAPAAKELSQELSRYNERLMLGNIPDDDVQERAREVCDKDLRVAWGKHYEAKLELARRTYRDAIERAPWLEDIVEYAGAGNSVTVVMRFAEIGERRARMGRRNG